MDFKQLEAFVAVVDWNSFSEAAKKLYLTQPTISAHIRTLEEELGTTLVNRTTKSLKITQDGYKLYDYAVSLLKLRKKANEDFLGIHDTNIHIGVSTIPSAYILPDIMNSYRKHNPDCTFYISQSDSSGIVAKLLDGRIDVGIVGMSSGDRQLEFRPLIRDRIVLAAPANDYFKKKKEDKAPFEELLREPIILREQGSGTKKESDIMLERLNLTDASLNVVAYINDLESIKRCIKGGMGVSLVSMVSVSDDVKKGDLIVFDPPYGPTERYMYVVTRKDRVLPEQARSFVDYIFKMKKR